MSDIKFNVTIGEQHFRFRSTDSLDCGAGLMWFLDDNSRNYHLTELRLSAIKQSVTKQLRVWGTRGRLDIAHPQTMFTPEQPDDAIEEMLRDCFIERHIPPHHSVFLSVVAWNERWSILPFKPGSYLLFRILDRSKETDIALTLGEMQDILARQEWL